jgi:hypothetical protein
LNRPRFEGVLFGAQCKDGVRDRDLDLRGRSFRVQQHRDAATPHDDLTICCHGGAVTVLIADEHRRSWVSLFELDPNFGADRGCREHAGAGRIERKTQLGPSREIARSIDGGSPHLYAAHSSWIGGVCDGGPVLSKQLVHSVPSRGSKKRRSRKNYGPTLLCAMGNRSSAAARAPGEGEVI